MEEEMSEMDTKPQVSPIGSSPEPSPSSQENIDRKDFKKSADSDSEDDSDQTSRSGRVIKPKKFFGDEEEVEDVKPEINKPQPSTSGMVFPSTSSGIGCRRELTASRFTSEEPDTTARRNILSPDMGRLMWAKTRCGQMVHINLDCERPATFSDEKSRLVWERATEICARRLRGEIEAGEITREDIRAQLRPSAEQEAILSPLELFEMRRERFIERKLGRMRWMKLETRMRVIDRLIRSCLGMEKDKIDVGRALGLMDEMMDMPLDPLMLKKHPRVVETSEKLRGYVGNAENWNVNEEEERAFDALAVKVREKANSLCKKYASVFAFPESGNFWSYFVETVNEFSKVTQHMPRGQVCELIIDPSSPYFHDVCEDDREDEEFKLKYNISADELIAQRRAVREAGGNNN